MGERQPKAEALAEKFPNLHRWAYKRFYMDNVYQFITHRIIFAQVSATIAKFDRQIIDGFFNFLAWGTHRIAYSIRNLQNGSVQSYAAIFLAGTLGLAAIVFIASTPKVCSIVCSVLLYTLITVVALVLLWGLMRTFILVIRTIRDRVPEVKD